MIRAVFYGTPQAAVPALAGLASVAEVVLVVTRPDRAKGRSGRPVAPAVKEAAEAWGLPLLQPESGEDESASLARLKPDVAVVTAYGRVLPEALLRVPAAGFVNVHFSLLPRWRGASPVVRAILAGDETTGVTIMQLDAGLDTGPIHAVRRTPIAPADTAGTLTARLAGLGAELLAETLPSVVSGSSVAEPQDEALATAAAPVRTEEAFLDPTRHGSGAVVRAVRAFAPRPGAWGIVDGRRFKVWSAAPAPGEGPEPGVVEVRGSRVLLGARGGVVALGEVQPAGKPRMAAADWMRGRRGAPAHFAPATR